MSEPHAHFPDYAYYHSRRSRNKQLTCAHCGKPIYCTNDHLSLITFLPVIPALIVFSSPSLIAKLLSIIALSLLIPLLQRLIFPKLHFEIDNDAMRGDMTRYRNRK